MYVLMYISGMSRQYSIVEARNSLPRIVDQAEAGAEVHLTRRGKPVAAVVGLRLLDELRGGRTDFRGAYRAFLGRYSLDAVGLEPDFFASARAQGSGRTVAL
jgi:prevent-host-death family protein